MEKKRASRYMSQLLRHTPEKEGLDIDIHGYVTIKQLIFKLDISLQTLEEIVAEDDKQRFSFDDTKTKIRASQGHSIEVDLQLESVKPPSILYHGTATKYLSSIYKEGIKKGDRKYLHLSEQEQTAISVGKRHGDVYVLTIDTEKMYQDGYSFYISKNGVWLTDFVPRIYIKN